MTRTTQNSSHKPIEKYVAGVGLQGGIYTNLPMVFNNNVTVNSGKTLNLTGVTVTGLSADVTVPLNLAGKNAAAFSVGLTSANPALNVNTNTTLAVTGISVNSNIATSGVAIQEISSGTNESMTLDAKGTGTVGINTVATTSGAVTVGNSTSNAGLTVNGSVTTVAGGVKIPTGQTYQINSLPIPSNEYVNSNVLAAATFVQNTSYPLWTAPNDGATWKVANVSYRFTAQAGAAATFSVEVAGAATAPGSGTAQTGALSLQGTANTTINGTVTTQTTISAGSSLNLVVSNTAATTSLAGLVIVIVLQRQT
jgi:hypothetical protein